MIKGWKELGDIERQSTHHVISSPIWLDEVSESYTYIQCRPLFEVSQLIEVDEVIRYKTELKLLADNFLNKFS